MAIGSYWAVGSLVGETVWRRLSRLAIVVEDIGGWSCRDRKGRKRGLQATPRRPYGAERGRDVVEFTLITLLFMVPRIYSIITMGVVQYGCRLTIPLLNFPHFNNYQFGSTWLNRRLVPSVGLMDSIDAAIHPVGRSCRPGDGCDRTANAAN